MLRKVAYLKENWELAATVGIVALQAFLIGSSVPLYIYGGLKLQVTSHALVMLSYKMWQKSLSVPSNLGKMRQSREPIVKQLAEISPEHYEKAVSYLGKYMELPTFRKRIFDLGVSEEIWKRCVNNSFRNGRPPVSIVVPIYDILHEILSLQVDSIVNQYYDNIHWVYLGVNDADDIATVEFLENLIATKYAQSSIKFKVLIEPKAGKRNVQKTMFDLALKDGCKYIIHMDGDGFADPNQTDRLVFALENDPKIGVVTGYVDVINKNDNILTKNIYIKYNGAFYDERSAQGDDMICPSGPNFAIRVDVLALILDMWYKDKFRGLPMFFGDDRAIGYYAKLLALIAESLEKEIPRLKSKAYEIGIDPADLDVLSEKLSEQSFRDKFVNLKVNFYPDSVVYTDVPNKLSDYKPQQKRWHKSAWIYNYKLYVSGVWKKANLFTKLSVAYLTFYPFVVMASLFYVVISVCLALSFENYLLASQIFAYYGMTIVFVHWIFFSLTGYWLTGDLIYFWSPFYFYLWLDVQFRAKINSFQEIDKRGWDTRTAREETKGDIEGGAEVSSEA